MNENHDKHERPDSFSNRAVLAFAVAPGVALLLVSLAIDRFFLKSLHYPSPIPTWFVNVVAIISVFLFAVQMSVVAIATMGGGHHPKSTPERVRLRWICIVLMTAIDIPAIAVAQHVIAKIVL